MAASCVACIQCLADQSPGPLQLGHLGVDASLNSLQAPTLRGARSLAGAVGSERVNDLSDCEAQLLELPRQADPVEIVLIEGAVTARGAGGRLQNAAALVEADCVDGNVSGLRERPDAHAVPSQRTALPARV